MTNAQRDQLATPVVLVYWLMIVGGLLVYGVTQTRQDASLSSFAALWAGAVGGTLLGQCLALRDFRLWITALVIAVVVVFGAPIMPHMLAGPMLWRAFIPATLCGFWSLGDRTALVACWFPTVIWMLSIIDRSNATRGLDGTGVALLAALAALFLLLLRVRESRRVGLWRALGPLPLAPTKPPELLREPPARQLASAGWGLTVTAIAIAVTAWIAPSLWQRDRLVGHTTARSARHDRPCCPIYGFEIERLRVKEYLELGSGRDAHVARSYDGTECRICPGVARSRTHWRPAAVDDPMPSTWGIDAPIAPRARISAPELTAGTPAGAAAPTAAIPEPGPDLQDLPSPALSSDIASPAHASWSSDDAAPVVASPTTAIAAPPAPAAPIKAAPLTSAPPIPAQAPHNARLPPPAPAAPPTTNPEPATATDTAAADDAPGRARTSTLGPSLVHGLMWLCLAALVFQLVSLALRPVRRIAVLRHLRHPFWNETVAQRVSNAWQLALVGLRDAGWRPGPGEAPHELARRVGVEGLERCAMILERVRHGIGIDADDLGAMSTAADTAYRAARAGLGSVARAVGWLRWPLT